MTRRSFRRPFALALLALALAAGPAAAADSGPGVLVPVFAGYWQEFLDHWGGVFKKQNGVIMTALGLGAVSLFIITRGKWKK